LGFNKEEAGSFPDNSLEFVNQSNNALSFSTLNKVRVLSFSIDMNKTQILENLTPLLLKYNLLSNIVWSCYNSYDKMCGKCQSCLRLKNAIIESKMGDRWQDLFLA
jgi:7-cyano-7-deazaguanine synthase